MKYKDKNLRTAFDIGYELKDPVLGGKKITRNIQGFNITMHFKKGVCKIKINNIAKINVMKHIPEMYRNIDFEKMGYDFEYRLQQIEKLEYTLNKIKESITKEYYDIEEKVTKYNAEDLQACYLIRIDGIL